MFTGMYRVFFVSKRSYYRDVCRNAIRLTTECDMFRNMKTISRSAASSQSNRMAKSEL